MKAHALHDSGTEIKTLASRMPTLSPQSNTGVLELEDVSIWTCNASGEPACLIHNERDYERIPRVRTAKKSSHRDSSINLVQFQRF